MLVGIVLNTVGLSRKPRQRCVVIGGWLRRHFGRWKEDKRGFQPPFCVKSWQIQV